MLMSNHSPQIYRLSLAPPHTSQVGLTNTDLMVLSHLHSSYVTQNLTKVAKLHEVCMLIDVSFLGRGTDTFE